MPRTKAIETQSTEQLFDSAMRLPLKDQVDLCKLLQDHIMHGVRKIEEEAKIAGELALTLNGKK